MKQNFKRKLLAGVLSVCMIFQTAGMVPVYAVGNGADSGIPVGASSVCENHTEHDEECGYVEGTKGSPCTHEHTEDCYIEVEKCIHKHTDECYPETDDEEATKSDEEEPTECTHMCDEESGCFTKKLNCQHEHDEACGYVEAVKGSPCTHSCELCAKDGEEAIKEDVVEDIELATDSNAQEISKENIAKVQAMIDALPTLEELKAIIDKDEQTAIYTKLQTAYEAYEALTKEEQGEVVGAEIFEPLFGWYNSQMMLMAEQNIAIEPLEGATQYYATLADALTAAQTDENSGCTVKLLTDVTTTEQIEVKTGKFTLDFNGHTWSYNKDAAYTAALSVYGADVTLTATGGGGITYTAGTGGYGFLLWMYRGGSLTITGGEYNSNSSTRVTVVRAENLTQPGQLTITGGTFIVTDNSAKKSNYAVSASNCSKGSVEISGGTFKSNTGSDAVLFFVSGTSSTNTIADLLANDYAYRNSNGTAWITDTTGTSLLASSITVKQAPVKITKQTEDDITVLPGYVADDALKLSVTAQKLIADDSKTVSYQWKESVNGAVAEDIIEATTDTYTIPTDLAVGSYAYTCAVTCDGYTVTSKPVTFTVKTAVASVTTSDGGTITNYATLADAIATAQLPANSGCTVKLLGAVETTGQIDATAGTFTLDFNGKTWSFNNITHGKAALYIGGAEVTLNATDGGGIKGIDNADNQAYLLNVNGSNSKLTVNGGEYSCGSTANLVIALHADMLKQSGQLTITGGTFVGGGDVNYASALYAYYCGKGTIAIRGGTFKAGSASVLYFNSDASYITTPADLLADGYGYKEGDGWVTYPTAASTAGKTITVAQTPVKITAQPQNKTIYYGYTEATLSLAATAVDISKEFTYQWYSVGTGADGADQVITDATTNTLTIPQGKALGDYQYYCKLTCDGYTLQSSIATVTISQSGTTFDGGIKTYKDSTDTTTFTYGDTITVKVTPKATGMAPKTRTFAAPAANQMALFIGETQITEPKTVISGQELTFTIDTTNKEIPASLFTGIEQTITAKYVGNDNMATFEDNVNVTLNKKAITSAPINAIKVYDGTNSFTDVALTLTGIESGDTVTATANGTSASKDVADNYTFTVTSVTLGGTHAGYYSLANTAVSGDVAITAKPLTDAMISGIAANYDYSGKAIEPTPTVTDGTPSIIATSDYTVSYGANKKVSTGGTVTITATSGGNYSGTVSKSFTIGKANSTAGLTVDKSDKTYTYGDTITFTVNVGLPKAKLFARAAAINIVDFYLGTDTTGTKLNSSAITLTETGGTGTATFAYDTTKNTAIPFDDNITVTAEYGGSGNLNGQTVSLSDIQLQRKAISGTVTIDVTNGTGSEEAKIDQGDTLTANVTAIQPTDAQSGLTYQWYRGTGAIVGSTNQTYEVAEADKGQKLQVKVTAAGNYSGVIASAEVEVDKEPIKGSISITGNTALGDTLTLDKSSLTPTSATFTTKWQRDGVDITGATAETYQLTKDDLGKTIMVLITATDAFTGSMTATKDIPSIKPEKPVITATAGNEQVVLTWTAPFDGGSAITGYELTVTPGITGSPFTIAGSEASYTVTGLTNGTGYEFTLKATNAKGDSEVSDVVSATPNVAYTVTFQSNGGSTVAEQQVTAGNKVTKPADPTKPDHRFDGWYKDSAFTTVWDFDTDTVQADTTIYAKWTPVGSNGDTLDNNTGNGNNSTAGGAAKIPAASNQKSAVNTGDTTSFVWLIALLALSGAGIIAVSVWKRRKRQ